MEPNRPIRVIVFRRTNLDIYILEGRDVWWHRILTECGCTICFCSSNFR
ncbi:MAG: hypothetical protein WBL40_14870 [Terrimicrobiaceae bacterium]